MRIFLGVKSRMAEAGDELVVFRFPAGVLGFASREELDELKLDPTSRWERFRQIFAQHHAIRITAVHIPYGSHLILRQLPPAVRGKAGLADTEEAIYVRCPDCSRRPCDALRFRDGRHILIQNLLEGQEAYLMYVPVDVREAMGETIRRHQLQPA